MGTGIAIDQTGIRIIQARYENGDVSLTGAGYFPFNEPHEDWQQGFVRFQKDYELPSGSGYIGVSGKHLSLRHVRLPARNERELSNLVEKEVKQFTGSHQQGDMTHAYQRLPGSGADQNEISVLVGILRSEWIMQASELLKRHDLQLEGCIPDAVSIFEAYRTCPPPNHETDDVTMLAWLGYNSIDICLVRNRQFVGARSTRGGISTILEAAPNSGNKNKAFQQLIGKPDAPTGKASLKDTDALLDRSVSKLSLRLSTAYDYFVDEFPNLPDNPDRVLLSGQAARISSLPRKLSSSFGQRIDVYNPAKVIDTASFPDHKQEDFETVGPEWTTALGLAMAQEKRRSDLLLFKTPAAQEKEEWWNVRMPSIVGLTFLFCTLLIYGLQSTRVNSTLQSNKQQLQRRATTLQQRDRSYQTRIQNARSLQSATERLQRLKQHSLITLQVLRDLPTAQPDEATISSLTLNQETLQVDGFIPKHVPNSLDVIKRFYQNLSKNMPFSVNREPRTSDENDNEQFRFIITPPDQENHTDAE